MKKRLLSLFLAFVTLLGILPTAALAANTEEEALGEVDIYNGGYELSYLTINGRIRTQDYTYFNYVDAKGQKKEVPAYCVNPNIKGVPQTVGVGESIKYLANERSSDPKVVGIISNGYPHRSLGELKLDNKYQAYYATKMALWCYLLPNWNIANLKVAPGLTGSELDIGNRILAAAKDIYKRGTTYNYMLEPRMTATPDKSAAYSVTVDGKQYKQQVFTIWSETWVYDYDIAVSFADPGSVPQGTRIVDENDQDITAVTTKWTGDGYGGKFKVLYPADSIEGESGSVQLSLTADVAQYAAMYAVCQEKDKYGNLQNYICDLDNSRHMELAAVSSYTGGGEPDPKETALKIVKLEEGTKIPLEGAVFSVYPIMIIRSIFWCPCYTPRRSKHSITAPTRSTTGPCPAMSTSCWMSLRPCPYRGSRGNWPPCGPGTSPPAPSSRTWPRSRSCIRTPGRPSPATRTPSSTYPGILDTETFQCVQSRIQEKTAKQTPKAERQILKLADRLHCASCGSTLYRMGGKNHRKDTLYLKCAHCGITITIQDEILLEEVIHQMEEWDRPEQTSYQPSGEVIRLTNAINRGLEHPDDPQEVISLILQGVAARYACCPDTQEHTNRPLDVCWDHIRLAVSHINISEENTVKVTFQQEHRERTEHGTDSTEAGTDHTGNEKC